MTDQVKEAQKILEHKSARTRGKLVEYEQPRQVLPTPNRGLTHLPNSTRRQAMNKHICTIAGCEKPVKGRGWCSMHYTRWQTHGDPLHETKLHPLVKDMTGQRFGKLIVQEWAGTSPGRKAAWLCICDCGNPTRVTGDLLRQGKTTSCGCVKKEAWRHSMTHGQAGPTRRTSIYNRWILMKRRCGNPKAADYPRYGGRGIQVCDEWQDSFEAFYAYMGDPPGPGYSIDRIDNNGNYEPGNVRWATASEQALNRRPRRKNE